MDEVTGTVDEPQGGRRDQVGESASDVGRDPFVLRAPEDPDRDRDLAEACLDLPEEALVGLLDLPVEGRLPDLPGPRGDQLVEIVGAKPAVAGGLDVRAEERPMNVRR